MGSQPSPPTTEPGPVPSSPSQEPPTKREYDQCRIQVLSLISVSLQGSLRASNAPSPELFSVMLPLPNLSLLCK